MGSRPLVKLLPGVLEHLRLPREDVEGLDGMEARHFGMDALGELDAFVHRCLGEGGAIGGQ
jgi:hypothetical protein